MKIIHYIPRRKTPLLYFPTSMEEEKYVVIGKDIYEGRKEILSRRIEAMIDYTFSSAGCRVKKMLQYFGESEADDCRTCDICRDKKQEKTPSRLSDDNLSSAILSYLKDNSSGIAYDDIYKIFGKKYSKKVVEILRMLCEDSILKASNGKWILNKR